MIFFHVLSNLKLQINQVSMLLGKLFAYKLLLETCEKC